MKTKVQRWGNSLAVRIPKTFAEEVGLAEDTPVEMRLVKGGLLVEPSAEWAPSLHDLVDAITDENRHEEVDPGGPRGVEVW